MIIIPWLKKIIWVIGVIRRTVVSGWRFDNRCGRVTWLWRWLPHRLSKLQSLTTVLLMTPITQMIFFNQGMLLLGSNHFLMIIIALQLIARKWWAHQITEVHCPGDSISFHLSFVYHLVLDHQIIANQVGPNDNNASDWPATVEAASQIACNKCKIQ